MLGTLTASLGIRRAVRLVESSRLNVPAVIGVIRPVILLPLGLLSDLAPDQVQAILIHELAHIRRHDYLVNLLQVVVESLLFYHPATWWISSQIRREREHCCDDIAASRFTARDYVSALLALEQRRWPTVNALVAATGGTLLERVQRVLGHRAPGKARPIRSAVEALAVLACIFVPIALDGCDKSKPSTSSPSTAASAVGDDSQSSGIVDDDLKPDYSHTRFGPNDLVQISIDNLAALGVQTTIQRRVSDPDGTIALLVIPKPFKIAGMTDQEAGRAIAKVYRDGQVISDARVEVSLVEGWSATFTILGSGVDRPGKYPITDSDFRLTQALTSGRAHLEGQTTIVVERRGANSTTRTLNIPVAKLMAGNPQVNVTMRPGDVVILPPSDKLPTTAPVQATMASVTDHGEYYIGGTNTKRVGVYALPAGKITLKQAIIAAGGADDGYVSVFRREGQNVSPVLANARYTELLSGAVDDLFLHPGDTIMFNPSAQPWQGATTQQAVRP
jgi:protein involved in polysaccharide export with SLBB domain